MKKVSIIGSGNVGANSAFFIAETAAANVTLVDVKEGLSEGMALDLMEAAPIRNYRTLVEGSSDLSAIAGSDVVVIAAGLIRRPGQRRTELFKENAPIVAELCSTIVERAPDALVAVATEPVDAMVRTIIETTGFDRRRVMGIGGLLDSARMAHFTAEELGVSPRDVTSIVVGSHTVRMVPLPDYTRVNGIPIGMLLSQERVDKIVAATREAGDAILDLAKRANAYYSPSAAIAQVIEAVCIDTGKVIPLSVMLKGEYGISGVALSVPCRIGAGGVQEILSIDLSEKQQKALLSSAEPVNSCFQESA